ncbi:MAG: methylmalonyl-CoA epimerase [Gemmatimonadota bacterium]|nr:methylmalonyl-CoA epimerase [Gemmatimonadota bacterium]
MNIRSLTANGSLDHVAVAVHSLDEGRALFELLTGEAGSPPEILESQGVRVSFVGSVELLEPLGSNTTVGRFLQRRGPGLHHIAYRVDDLEAELARLEAEGLRLVDRKPRRGAKGHLVAFVHPSSTGGVLVELVQHGT